MSETPGSPTIPVPPASPVSTGLPNISYDDFRKLDIRVVQITSAEHIPGKTKILKAAVDIGGGATRTIVVGGADYYPLDYFVGKKFIALLNLAPRKIAGIESQGMLLAADMGAKPIWLTLDPEAPVGAPVR